MLSSADVARTKTACTTQTRTTQRRSPRRRGVIFLDGSGDVGAGTEEDAEKTERGTHRETIDYKCLQSRFSRWECVLVAYHGTYVRAYVHIYEPM